MDDLKKYLAERNKKAALKQREETRQNLDNFQDKWAEIGQSYDKIGNLTDLDEIEKEFDKIDQNLADISQSLGLDNTTNDNQKDDDWEEIDKSFEKIKNLTKEEEIVAEFKNVLSNLDERQQKFFERFEIKAADKYLLLPLIKEELPNRCIFCNCEGHKQIKIEPLRSTRISKRKLKKMEAKPAYDRDEKFNSEFSRRFLKKLGISWIIGYISLAFNYPFAYMSVNDFAIFSLLTLFIFLCLFIKDRFPIYSLTYSLCLKHLILRRLVIFISWSLFFIGAILSSLAIFILEFNEYLKLGIIIFISSLLIDLFFSRLIMPFYRVGETSDNETIIIGAGKKFLNSFKKPL